MHEDSKGCTFLTRVSSTERVQVCLHSSLVLDSGKDTETSGAGNVRRYDVRTFFHLKSTPLRGRQGGWEKDVGSEGSSRFSKTPEEEPSNVYVKGDRSSVGVVTRIE